MPVLPVAERGGVDTVVLSAASRKESLMYPSLQIASLAPPWHAVSWLALIRKPCSSWWLTTVSKGGLGHFQVVLGRFLQNRTVRWPKSPLWTNCAAQHNDHEPLARLKRNSSAKVALYLIVSHHIGSIMWARNSIRPLSFLNTVCCCNAQ